MKKVILVDGSWLHLILGKSVAEWNELYGEDEDLWDVSFEELLDGTLEINQDVWYWYIDGRCYETDEEV